MSLWESGHSTGSVPLEALFDGETPSGRDSGLTVRDLVQRIVIGGWPSLLDAEETEARRWLGGYIRNAIEVDVPALGARRDPRNLRRLLAALARGVGRPVKATALAADVGGDRGPIATSAVYAYLDALERLMLLDNSEAWLPHMRSRLRLRTSPVRYFVDPSLGTAALEVGSAELLADLNATGYHFEALAIRDLRIYAQALGGSVGTWRDESGHEIDAVITLPGGRWGAFEVSSTRRQSRTPREVFCGSLRRSTPVRSDRQRCSQSSPARASPAGAPTESLFYRSPHLRPSSIGAVLWH